MSRVQILQVRWEDITDTPGWYPDNGSPEDYAAPLQCMDVGFKVKETTKNLYLSKTYARGSDGLRWGGLIVIPKGCIRERKIIRIFDSKELEQGITL